MGDLGAGLVSGVHTTGPDLASPRELSSPTVTLSGKKGGGKRQYAAMDTGLSVAELVALDERGVAQWVANRSPKLAPFAHLFEEHQIEGALFLRLSDEMLREMGINRERLARLRLSVWRRPTRSDSAMSACSQ